MSGDGDADGSDENEDAKDRIHGVGDEKKENDFESRSPVSSASLRS
eukprot:CAMPEP_0114517788 /NCGR_PEP_ID=MMETSP0109-20121206/18086_1 /TAXON_ID=29199 /ORGANISM="Chlorarachnion reptans, Strain CCCM449" /LENGTH=45 /DNA_ID= /DNA_START= /DNA_END= /DNA_ORIENTATION=